MVTKKDWMAQTHRGSEDGAIGSRVDCCHRTTAGDVVRRDLGLRLLCE